MVTTNGKTRCAICSKDNATVKCEGCSQTYCYNHVGEHRQQLNRELEDVATDCDCIRELLAEQRSLMQKINQWERESIKKILEKAEEIRKLLAKYTIGTTAEIEAKLNNIAKQIKQNREDNDFYESDLRRWKESLTKLNDKLQSIASNITIREDSTSFVSRIHVDLSAKGVISLVPQLSVLDTNNNHVQTRWVQDGITIAGSKESGHGLNQFYNPLGMSIDDDGGDNQIFYIADYWNNRIIRWRLGSNIGKVAVNGTIDINETYQINRPTNVVFDKRTNSLIICDTENQRVVQQSLHDEAKLKTILADVDCWGIAMDKYGYLYVSDRKRHEVKRLRIGDTNWKVVAGGNGNGGRLNQLSSPTSIFVDDDQSIYVSDRDNHRVMKWKSGAIQGVIVAGNQTEGSRLEQLSNPAGILVDQIGTIYVADSDNHRVMQWPKGATEGSIVVGGNSHGNRSNQLYNPWGLCFDRQGNLYVADNFNHRIQRFNVDFS